MEALRNPWAIQPVPALLIDSETLWLARLIYSESKRADEQELVAWVVRNRAESGYRGRHSIEAVTHDPYQFSAFVPGSDTYRYYTGLTAHTVAPGWQRTLALAYYVRHAPASLRPFSPETRHFYSERSLSSPDSLPAWTVGMHAVTPSRPIRLEARRFRFYAGIR